MNRSKYINSIYIYIYMIKNIYLVKWTKRRSYHKQHMYYIFLVNDRTSNDYYINIIPIYNTIYIYYMHTKDFPYFLNTHTQRDYNLSWNLAIVSSSTTTTYVIHSIQAFKWINNTKIIIIKKDTNYKLQFTYIYHTYIVKIINIFANIFPLTKQANTNTIHNKVKS